MSAHQVAPTASTLRAAYDFLTLERHILAERRVLGEVIAGDGTRSRCFPSRAASSGVRTRSIDMEDGGFGMRLSGCMKKPSVASSR